MQKIASPTQPITKGMLTTAIASLLLPIPSLRGQSKELTVERSMTCRYKTQFSMDSNKQQSKSKV